MEKGALLTSTVISIRQDGDLASLHDLMMGSHIRHIYQSPREAL